MQRGRHLGRLVEVHSLGRDCRLTAARDVLHYFGFPHSPAIVYGLSASYNFSYVSSEKSLRSLLWPELGEVARDHFLTVSGHRLEVFENLAYAFGGILHQREREPLESLLQTIDAHLAEGIPVLVAVCQQKVLERVGRPYRWPAYLKLSGFGGHWVQVVGMDPARHTVTLLESNQREPIDLSFAALEEARGYGEELPDFLMKSRGRWAVFVPSSEPPPLAEQARCALVKAVYGMSDGLGQGSGEGGLAGLCRFSREFPAWPDWLPLPKYKASLFMLKVTSEGLLSGSLGRRGFGIFLRRAGSELRCPPLKEAALEYGEAAGAWEALVTRIGPEVLDPASEAVLPREETAPLCAEVYARESRAFEKLAAVVRTL